MKFTTEYFIARAREVHGDRYDYSLVNYIGCRAKVKIVCKLHGEFLQSPNDHTTGRGCKKCSGVFMTNLITFVEQAKLIHGNTYSYKNSKYAKSGEPLEIVCSEHGSFWQSPSMHCSGQKCPKCALVETSQRMSLNTLKYIERANKKHNNKYSYLKTNYVTSKDKIIITCNDHGDFYQEAAAHMSGQGCPSCASYGFFNAKVCVLYVFIADNITKVGVTKRATTTRLKEIVKSSGMSFVVLYEDSYESSYSAYAVEQRILRYLKNQYLNVSDKFDGSKECFYDVNIEELLSKIEQHKGTTWKTTM